LRNLGLLELLGYLLVHGRVSEAQQLIARHCAWLEMAQSTRLPVRRRAERGIEDVDGHPLGEVTFNPEWLIWNGGTVRKMADGIKAFRTFEDLPILADALQEAGCVDDRILRHLRAKMTHDSRCWVLRILLALDA
jgi:hypothetical protein